MMERPSFRKILREKGVTNSKPSVPGVFGWPPRIHPIHYRFKNNCPFRNIRRGTDREAGTSSKSIAEAHQSPAVTWGVGGACYNVKRELRRNGGARRVYLFNEWNHGTSQETVRRETAPKIPGSVAPATQSRLLEQLGRTPLHRWDNATLLRNPRHPNTGSGS